jgi:DNA-binding CsgD family transcriptional regulator
MVIIALWAADALVEARAALDEALAVAQRTKSPLGFVLNSAWRSHVAWRAGDLSTAEADAQAVLDVSRELGLPPGILYGVAGLADVLVDRGELDAAERLFVEAGLDGALHGTDADQPVLFARGRLRAAQGRPHEALADQLACGEGLASFGMRMPLVPWGSEAALAAAAAGLEEEAERLITAELTRARASAAPRALGVALRAAGTIRHDRRLLEDAVAVLEPSPARLELAHALFALGDHAGADAIELLRRALDLADRCGASALAGRAREALRAAGARPRRARVSGPAALTASERRVAALAAAGHSNREIAEALFVTPRTVELHLTSTYRKLGVQARGQLAPALADDG